MRSWFPNFSETGPYLRRGDRISLEPIVGGVHEAYLDALIAHFAQEQGLSDFLIDVGANIGLTVFQNGHQFGRVLAYEPNPLVFNILKTNVALAGHENVELVNAGLAANDGIVELSVPRGNFGGAFIAEGNHLSRAELMKKDGLEESSSKSRHLKLDVALEGQAKFEERLTSFAPIGTKGMVKVDVEGYEPEVLRVLLPALAGREFAVVFENLAGCKVSEVIGSLDLVSAFSVKVYRVTWSRRNGGSRLRQVINLVRDGGYVWDMVEVSIDDTISAGEDVVIHCRPT